MKKRTLSLICIFCLILTMLPISVFAAGGSYDAPTLNLYASYLEATNQVKVSVKLGKHTALGALDFWFKYDDEKLSVKQMTPGGAIPDLTVSDNKTNDPPAIGAGWFSMTDAGSTTTEETEILTVLFDVIEGKTGDVEFSFLPEKYNFCDITGENYVYEPGAGSITSATATIPKAPITSVSAKVNVPVKGMALDTTGTVDVSAEYTITNVAWFEGAGTSGSSASGTAAAGQVYTAKITLTAKPGESFANSLDGTTTGDGYQIKRTSDTVLELTKTFDPTADKTLSGIAISGTPTKTNYIHGDRFVIDGATVTATYDDGSTADVTSGCTFSYPSGKSYLSKDETKVTVNYGGKTADITGLTVGTKALTITGVAATNKKYDGTAVVALTGGTLQGVVSGETVNFTLGSGTASQSDVGSDLPVTTAITLTGADSGNYTLSQPAGITVNITPADNTVSTFTCADVAFGTAPSPSGATAASGTPTYSYSSSVSGPWSPWDTSNDIGTYFVRASVEASGNYAAGEKVQSFQVIAKSLSSATFDTVSSQPYTGSEIKPEPTVTLDSTPLTKGEDFTYTYSDNTYVGTATINVTGMGNYTSSATAGQTFNITAVADPAVITTNATVTKGGNTVDLSQNVSGAVGDVSYAVTSGTGSVDSTGVYTSPADSGTAVVTVTVADKDVNGDGTAEYTGKTADITITISDKATDTTTMSVSQTGTTFGNSLGDYTLTGKPGVTGTESALYTGTLRKGGSYSSSTKPTEAGTYTVTVTYETSGTIYKATSGTFTIAPASISTATVNLGSALTYNGTAQTQAVASVMLGGVDVISSCDVTGNTGTNATDYTLTVTAKDASNYDGQVEKQFTIAKKDITVNVTAASRPYGAANPTFVGTVDHSTPLASGDNYDGLGMTYQTDANAASNVGTYDVTGSGTNANYNITVAGSGKLTITKATAPTLANISVTQKYTVTTKQSKEIGKAGMPSNAGALSYTKGTASKTGSVTVSSWDVDSDGKVTFTLAGGANGDTVTLPIKINSINYAEAIVNVVIELTDKEAQAELTVTGGTSVVYGQTLQLGTIGGSGTGAVTYAVTPGTGEATIDSTGKLTPVKAGTVTVTATKAGDSDYNLITSAGVTITITKANPTGAPKYTLITTSGKTLADAGLTTTGSTLNPDTGTLEWVDDTGTVLPDTTPVTANTSYKWRFTPSDTTNYNALTGTVVLYSYSGGTGGGGGGGGVATYSITVEQTKNGTISVSPKSASKGSTVTITVKPDKGYELDTLKVLDSKNQTIKLTEKEGKFTFTMPAGKVTVKGSFAKEAPEVPEQIFADVPVDAYYYEAVKWAADKGITGGVGGNLFAPDQSCTRAQIVTFLWRAAGSPSPKSMSSFADVPADAYYAKAVAWAVENGITSGTGSGKFSPDAACTRAQCVTFLYRAAGSPAVSGSPAFSDVASDAYYAKAVKWAQANGITTGIGGGLFGSNDNCTRAQIVTFIYRYMEK